MPYPIGLDGPPKNLVDGTWPNGRATGIEASYAQAMARNLAAAIGDQSLRSVGVRCGVHHTTISAILRGDRWADLVTIARLETGLDAALWCAQ